MLAYKIQEICAICFIILHYDGKIFAAFYPDTSDYDAYGLKIAANDVQFVQAYGDAELFLVQYTPYDYRTGSLQCSFDYDDSEHYVYSVGVGIKQMASINPYFYFAGEVLSEDSSGNNGTFIGVWINQDPLTVQTYVNNRQSVSCDYFTVDGLIFLSTYEHQEFFVMAVEPYGRYAIGLAADFGFIYYPPPNANITANSSNIWPSNTKFNPYAADASDLFTIVAGLVRGSPGSRIRATPTVYLIWNTNLTILSTWSYTATNNSWQSRLTYSGIDSWNSKYTMSVKINSDDPTRVLVGMPFLNTAFLFSITNSGTVLALASSIDNGQTVGFGKSVTWLTNSQAAILVSTYSLDYVTWYSSKIYLYTSLNDTTLPSSSSAVIPNAQQPIPSTINANLIQIISTPSSLVVLDTDGGVILILAEPAGSYASTDTTNSPLAASMPVVTHPSTCISGTYKSDAGVHPCTLCPNGTRNPGRSSATTCIPCSSTSFCPLGAFFEVNSSVLTSLSQAYAYPRTPEMDVFEDILLANMFSLGPTAHCVVISPIFWTLMLLAVILLLLLGMASLNWCVQPPKRDQWRTNIKNCFQKTDLVGEGELWVGGLASIAVVVVSAMAYGFAISYLNQYPSEKVGPSTFACDSTIRNAKFETSLQALAVPVSDEEQIIFSLLDDQNFTLQLDFINTNTSCGYLSVYEVTEASTTLLSLLSCSETDGVMSAKVYLPQHDIKLEATINDIQTIGGIALGLSGPSEQNDLHILRELNFRETFYSSTVGTLAQTVDIEMMLTKVINETEPLSGSDSEFGGIWYPTFTYSINQMFLTADGYVKSADQTSTTLTIDISETSYYIKNVQSPIAKQSEVIFRTLLFAFLCLELCAMGFLVVRLLLIPLYNRIARACGRKEDNKVKPEEDLKQQQQHQHY